MASRYRYVGKKRKPIYGTGAWRRLRVAILQRDHYWCTRCKRRVAKIVHHIIPITERPDLAFTESNLTSLCSQCHEIEEQRRLGTGAKKTAEAKCAADGIRIAHV